MALKALLGFSGGLLLGITVGRWVFPKVGLSAPPVIITRAPSVTIDSQSRQLGEIPTRITRTGE